MDTSINNKILGGKMFLAINEIKDAKLRYSLIVGLLTLVSYLMFFLSGLAFGLLIRIDLLLIIGRQIQYYFLQRLIEL